MNNDRDKLIELYVNEFNNFLNGLKLINPNSIVDQNAILTSIDKTKIKFEDMLPNVDLTDDEKNLVCHKIESMYSIFQEEGSAILGDYEHDYSWYKKLKNTEGYEEYYWLRYKNYLLNQKHYAPKIVEVLENDTLENLMSYIGDPNEEDTAFSIRGLVMGDVQSGKTSNYLGLVTKAADAGYKVIFILTGTIESLRKQTQIRVEEGFIGFDSTNGNDVGVNRGKITPKAFTSRKKDFTSGDNLNTTYRISEYSKEPMVFVIKKNVSVLRKLYSSLKQINTTTEHEKINYPMLLIDDEADNASINTNKIDTDEDPTIINKYIRKTLSLFTKNTYVGFTATPFANVFISYDDDDEMKKDDLFPRDFIYALHSPSNYCGSHKYFYEPNDNVRCITDYDDDIMPLKHDKNRDNNRLFDSAYHAINTFILANTIRDIRDNDKNTHRSMLINISRFKDVHNKIKDIVSDYFKEVKRAVKQTRNYDVNYALTNVHISDLKKSFEKEYSNILIFNKQIKFEDIFYAIYDAIKDIEIVVVNSNNSTKLNYEDHKKTGLRVIAIGGLALSRGLTLEGLCCSYFYRNSAKYDVLMQMGRWFGYRDGYADLCKIFITEQSIEFYKKICDATNALKEDVSRMQKLRKAPIDFGIRVKLDSEELGITASNKMRSATKHIQKKTFYGNYLETPIISGDFAKNEQNINLLYDLLKQISIKQRDYNVKHPYFRNVNKKLIIELITKANIHLANNYFYKEQVIKFLNRDDPELREFDVLITGGEETSEYFVDSRLDINVPLMRRKYDSVQNGGIIRINGTKRHLISKTDPKFGLSKEDLQNIPENVQAEDYLKVRKVPLLVFYLIKLNSNFDLNNTDIIKQNFEEFKIQHLDSTTHDFLLGLAIFFPSKEGMASSDEVYMVNSHVDYYDKIHDDLGELEDE